MKTTSDMPCIISFLAPGMGQLIKQHFVKTIIVWLLIAGLYLFNRYYQPDIHIIYFAGFIIWAINVYDAYNGTKDINISND